MRGVLAVALLVLVVSQAIAASVLLSPPASFASYSVRAANLPRYVCQWHIRQSVERL